MTLSAMTKKKFWIVKPKAGTNQILNPRFDTPQGITGWSPSGAGVTIVLTGDHQRRGAYSMQVNPATDVASYALYSGGLSVVDGLAYTFSCDIKGVAGQTVAIYVETSAASVKGMKSFVATGYWQRQEVSFIATESVATYRAVLKRFETASTAPFYVDGAQFEQASKATTFMHGYGEGCRWDGAARASKTIRSAFYRKGGELIDFDDYCYIEFINGLGHGDWNQILTKMTSGGDMYQTHIRKSRQFSMVIGIKGTDMGNLESKRKILIDALRPDLLEGQEMILRYQGFADNGDEVTNPIDIVCVPTSGTLQDTPTSPTFQRAVLNFIIPSGLLQGAYDDGKELDLYANFPAEHIVKRDPNGNWCTWDGSTGTSLITGLNSSVYCMAEGPDGRIYVGGSFTDAGGVVAADYLARWNPITNLWESVVAGIGVIRALAFDANGDLYIGGDPVDVGLNRIIKITDLNGTPTKNVLGTGIVGTGYDVLSIVIAPSGEVYVGGAFASAGGVANTLRIAKWNGTVWSAVGAGLPDVQYSIVSTMAFAPNGHLYIGGRFENAAGANGDYLCYWDGTAFNRVGIVELNNVVWALGFNKAGVLYVGGAFTNAGDNSNADYIAKWTGQKWEALGTGINAQVYSISANNKDDTFIAGLFTSAGGLTLPDRVAVWSNGAWKALDIDLPGTDIVYSILPTSDGSLYIGGAFSTAGETPDQNAETGVVALNLEVSSASANVYPYVQVRGPGTLKGITNYSTGKNVQFDGLTLQPGEWIDFVFDPLNLRLGRRWSGRGNLMRYVVAGSDYGEFYLMPGTNYLSLFMTGTTAASGAFMFWSPQFWGLDGALL